jgi:hypothetical protein
MLVHNRRADEAGTDHIGAKNVRRVHVVIKVIPIKYR